MSREIVIGITLAATTYAFLALLPLESALETVAILLSFIAAVYVGFSLASRGALPLLTQILGSGFFVICAFLGLWVSWWFLVAGLALHGVWDFAHRGEHGRGIVPGWYVPFCAAYDVAIAALIVVLVFSN